MKNLKYFFHYWRKGKARRGRALHVGARDRQSAGPPGLDHPRGGRAVALLFQLGALPQGTMNNSIHASLHFRIKNLKPLQTFPFNFL
jgi:hypothetical protein